MAEVPVTARAAARRSRKRAVQRRVDLRAHREAVTDGDYPCRAAIGAGRGLAAEQLVGPRRNVSACPSNPRTRSVGRATSPTAADTRSYQANRELHAQYQSRRRSVVELYNTERPDSSPGYKPPVPEALVWPALPPGSAQPSTQVMAQKPTMH